MDKAAQELKHNPYLKRFRELIDQLMIQKGSLFVFDEQIKRVCKQIDDYFNKNNKEVDKFSLRYSMNLHISDQSLKRPNPYPVRGFGVFGNEVADNLRDNYSALCGFIFLSAYEAHRKYLYDITKLFLFHNPDMIETMVGKNVRDNIIDGMIKVGYDRNNKNQDYWDVFVGKMKREDVHKALVKASPDLEEWEKNMFRIDNPRKRYDVERRNKIYSDWNDLV